MSRLLHIIGVCALTAPLWAGESIVLKTGFELAADRHELDGAKIRIYSHDGVTEIAANLVERVETIEEPAVLAPVDAPPPPIEIPTPVKVDLSPAGLAEAVAVKYSLPYGFVAGVMRTESGFNPKAVSPKGAIGLMQLMPGTAQVLGVDPNKPSENADGGARYLRELLVKYEDRPDQVVLALAAYNAGPAAVEKYHGVPPYRETREYILRVLKAWNPPPVTNAPSASNSPPAPR